jgi:glycosyltransferase involved in cell wall biosynthesis
MRISLIGPIYPYRGGIAQYTYYLGQALERAGHERQIVSFKRQYPRWLYPGESDRDPSKIKLDLEADFILDPFYPWTWQSAVKSIEAFSADAVAIQWWTTFWAVPFAFICNQLSKSNRQPVYIIHNVVPHEATKFDRWLARLALRPAKGFLAQTDRQKERLVELVPKAKVNVCAFPNYAPFIAASRTKNESCKLLNLPEGKTILLFFGLVRPYKGLSLLLEALSLLRNKGIICYLVIAGEFWQDLEKYEQTVTHLGLSDQVFIDNRYIPNEIVPDYFNAADALVAPYLDGTQSAVVAVGLGYGIPMIISEKAAEGIHKNDRESVMITPTGDAPALAMAIQEFIKNPSKYQIQTRYARRDWEDLVAELLNCFQQ